MRRAVEEPKKPTIYTVAQAAGVSPATVSRALNARRGSRISAETVQRVRRVADQLGYEPTHAAVSLRTRRTKTIGLVLPRLTDGVLAVMFEAAEDRARSHGYQAVALSTRDDPGEARKQVKRLLERDVDGLIIATATSVDPVLDRLAASGVPFVLLNRVSGSHPAVASDDRLGGYLATKHLLGRGHERIGYIAGPLSTSTSSLRLDGYRHAHAEMGVPVDDQLIVEANFRADGGLDGAGRLLAADRPPTALFAASDATALGAMAAARDLGLRIPGDLAVVGFNDTEVAALLPVPLTSVALPLEDMGAAAVELLLTRLRGDEPVSRFFSPRLMVRATT
jgi:LacI family transcriptional regulator